MKRTAAPDKNMEQTILAVAEGLFLERGYALTSTVEIARRAGCNQALVHYYFRNKENLFQTIFVKKLQAFVQGLVSLTGEDLPFEQAIASIVESHFDMFAANPRLPFLVMNELMTNPERLKSLKAMLMANAPLQSVARLEKRLHEEVAKGKVRKMTMLDVAMTMVSLNIMLFLLQPIVKEGLDVSDKEFAEIIRHRRQEHVATVLRSLRP